MPTLTRSRPRLNEEQQRMMDALPGLIQKWEAAIGLPVMGVRVRRMRSRWGSCNPRTRRITLNLDLAKKPLYCLEYVVVHEIVHSLDRSHNHNFKALMTHYLPGWKEIRRELNSETLHTFSLFPEIFLKSARRRHKRKEGMENTCNALPG